MTSSGNDHESLPLVERLDPSLNAVDVFRRLSGLPHVVFFDSAMRHPELGRYSFVAADPVEWISVPADGSDALAQLANYVSRLPSSVRTRSAAVSRWLGRLVRLRVGERLGTRAAGCDR